MNNRYQFIIICISCIAIISCGGKKLKPSEFKKHIENPENGFIKKIDASPFIISCTYTPTEYMVVNHFRNNHINKDEFQAQENEFKKFDMYNLEITSSDIRDLKGLDEYFGFYMQQGIFKVCNKDTLPCDVYHAEPFNAVIGTEKIEIGFPEDGCEQVQIVFQKTPFSENDIIFTFDKKQLKIPAIKLD